MMSGCLLVKPRTDTFTIYPAMFEVRVWGAGRVCNIHALLIRPSLFEVGAV